MDDFGAGMVIALIGGAGFAGGFKCGQSNARSQALYESCMGERGTPVIGPAVSPDPVTKPVGAMRRRNDIGIGLAIAWAQERGEDIVALRSSDGRWVGICVWDQDGLRWQRSGEPVDRGLPLTARLRELVEKEDA